MRREPTSAKAPRERGVDRVSSSAESSFLSEGLEATMLIIVATLIGVCLAVLGLLVRRRLEQSRQERMDDNEYNTAVTLWEFARTIKSCMDDMIKEDNGLIDFRKIAVPHGTGFTLSLELQYGQFQVHAAPTKYNRTGRLSFYTDGSLIVRAGDHGGSRATEVDPEYTSRVYV